MIIENINIIKLEILFNIGKQLTKACNLSNFSTIVFRGLPIFIIIKDFYQFFFIAGHPL